MKVKLTINIELTNPEERSIEEVFGEAETAEALKSAPIQLLLRTMERAGELGGLIRPLGEDSAEFVPLARIAKVTVVASPVMIVNPVDMPSRPPLAFPGRKN